MQHKVILSKTTNAIISKSGAGNSSTTTRIGIPAEWAKAIGITKDDKKVIIEFTDNNEIVIKKAEK